MQSLIKFLALALLAHGAAAKCSICGEDNEITNPDGVLFAFGDAGGCEFVAGSSAAIPEAICPILSEIAAFTDKGQVTCEEFEDEVDDLSDILCGFLPEQVDAVCACAATGENVPLIDPDRLTLLQLIIAFFQALFGA